jgi:hypothetical protein
MKCFKPAWDIAFNKEHNMNGWRIEGMIPFTRHALWKKVEEDEVIAASKLTTPSSLASSTPSPAVVAALAFDTTLPTPGGLRMTTPPLDPSLLPPLPPLRIQRIPEAVLFAGDYLQTCAPVASGILNMEAIVMQNLRLLEASKVIGEWMRTITTEEDNENNMAKRISSRDIYGEAGSATGDTALAMLKAKEDKRVALAAAAAAKKNTTKDKRAKDTTSLVTTGSEILRRLEQLGPSELLRLKIDELHALLVNNDPLGSTPRPNKKEGQEKASLLPTVQAALGRFLAVAAASTPQAPPLPPIPFAPVTCEGETIPNLLVEGGPENFLPIFDSLFSYATDASADAEVPVAYE